MPRPAVSSGPEAVGPAAVGGCAGPIEEAHRSDGSNETAPRSAESSRGSLNGQSSGTPDLGSEPATTNPTGAEAEPGRSDASSKAPTRRTPWADLLHRVFEVDALCCPRCGGHMRVLAAIAEADVARRSLACMNLPTRAPPLARRHPDVRTLAWPAHEAPYTSQTDTSWSAFEFDQSAPAEWDVGA